MNVKVTVAGHELVPCSIEDATVNVKRRLIRSEVTKVEYVDIDTYEVTLLDGSKGHITKRAYDALRTTT